MSNIFNHNGIIAFHPGYYIAEIIEDLGITQAEFSSRVGIPADILSQLIAGQMDLTEDLAGRISSALGNSTEFWMNLQKSYTEKMIESAHLPK